MMRGRPLSHPTRKGLAYVLSLLVLTILVALTTAMMSAASLNVHGADNYRKINAAQLAAESGLEFMLLCLKSIELPPDTTAVDIMANLAAAMGDKLNETPNVGTGSVVNTGTSVIIPSIATGNVAFSAELVQQVGTPKCTLTVTGLAEGITRRVAVVLEMHRKKYGIFASAITSKGSISVAGNATIVGINDATEGNVCSMSDSPLAISAGGSATISGDLSVTNTDTASVLLEGKKLSVAGLSDLALIYSDHVHFGVEPPETPEIDVEPFRAMTTSVIDASTPVGGSGQVLTNVCIKANTNPTVGADTVVNGALFIESPNKVTFEGQTTVNGIIATEDGTGQDIVHNFVDFGGGVSIPGVDALPDTPEFAAIKKQQDTAILAPGFEVSFRGSASTINGHIAADKVKFTGATGTVGTVNGVIIGMGAYPLELDGTITLQFSREGMGDDPAGFKNMMVLDPVVGSYSEPMGD